MYSTHFKHKNTTRDLCLGLGRIRLFFSSVRYSILPGAGWCGVVHTSSHTRFIDRFMMSEVGDPLSLPFTPKTMQPHSVAQNRQTSFFFFFFFRLLASKERTYFWHFIDIISDFRLKGYSR